MTDDNRECEVPLIEQLRDIPKDYRTVRAIQWDEGGRETGHQFIPVGFMMHRAAAELESLVQKKVDMRKAIFAYDAAIRSCANEPEKMASFCTAQGDNLDTLYAAMIDAAKVEPDAH